MFMILEVLELGAVPTPCGHQLPVRRGLGWAVRPSPRPTSAVQSGTRCGSRCASWPVWRFASAKSDGCRLAGDNCPVKQPLI